MDLKPEVQEPSPDQPFGDLFFESCALFQGFNRLVKRWPDKHCTTVISILEEILQHLKGVDKKTVTKTEPQKKESEL